MDGIARKVIDAAFQVHRALGPGYPESVYENALALELEIAGIPFERQRVLQVTYRGRWVGDGKLDLLVGGRLVVELKSVERLSQVHVAQVIGYLRMSGHPLGLLINFNVGLLREGIRRVVLGPTPP